MVKLHHGVSPPCVEVNLRASNSIGTAMFSDLGELDAFVAELLAARDNLAFALDHIPGVADTKII